MAELVEDIFAVPIEEPLNSETLAAALFHGTLHLEHLAERLNSQFGPNKDAALLIPALGQWQNQPEDEKDFWRKVSLDLIQHARHRSPNYPWGGDRGGQDDPA